MAKVKVTNEEPLEKQLWKAADKLRKNIDAAEYKHVVLGLIFLKYISDSFEEHHAKLVQGEGDYAGADPEDRDEYQAENIFFVPQEARWSFSYKRTLNSPTSARWLMRQWMLLNMKTLHLKAVFCLKVLLNQTLTLPA
ncbi:MAG: type I restriction-modification system subunit M N-terminal domain-containing protein [Methylovulum sp.]|nr:type I restriction-modification system subunit M N-terminal domain-containing protein [Methylovulum sp.]